MKKKNVAALMAAALTASMLAGCGSSASSSAASTPAESTPAESVSESEAETTTADGDETLTVWAWDPNFNIYALKQAEALYQKDHPNFKLNIEENVYNDIETKLITAATSEDYSTLPDIFLMQDYSYHKMVANFPGIYTDLTDSGLDWDQFSGGKLADSTVDGHHYGLPFDNGASVMAVRSDMIENAGLTVEDFKDLTWSEFEEKAQKVVDANGVPMLTSSGGSELIIEMMQSAGASPVVDGEVKIADNAALKEALTVYKDISPKQTPPALLLYKAGGVCSPHQPAAVGGGGAEFLDSFGQFGDVQRFGEIVIHAGGQALLAVIVKGVGSHGQNGDSLGVRLAAVADGTGRCVAVHANTGVANRDM